MTTPMIVHPGSPLFLHLHLHLHRGARRFLGLAALLAGACAPAAPPPLPAPRAVAPPPPAPTPAAVASAPAEPDREIVELRGNGVATCGRTEKGALHCWGYLGLPGEPKEVSYTRPELVKGLPPLAGFTLMGVGTLIGWDAKGEVFSVVHWDPKAPIEARPGVLIADPATMTIPGGLRHRTEKPRVRAASSTCLLTVEGQALCKDSPGEGPYFAVMPGRYRSLGTGKPCAVTEDGRVVELNSYDFPSRAGGKEIPPFSVAPLGSPDMATSLACFWDKARNSTGACGLDPQGALQCTNPGIASRLKGLAEGRAIREVRTEGEALCVTRDDGQARCLADSDVERLLRGALVGVDASRGYVLGRVAGCALGGDGLPRCWGERGSALLGDGSSARLAAPQRVEGLQGVVELSTSGGISCARFDADRVRCFGRIGSSVVEPRDLKLPEPVDRIVGGFPLCVRGAKSQGYFCRDAWGRFFPGSLADGFEPLRDTAGRNLGKAVTSVSVDAGLGVTASTADGKTGAFHFSGRSKPLRIDFTTPLYPDPIRTILYMGHVAIRQDGRGIALIHERTLVTPVPAVAMTLAKAPCFLDEARQVHCYDESLARTSLVARDVVELEVRGAFLTSAGEVFRLPHAEHGATSSKIEKIEGLPPMVQLANECGRSAAGEVWCWGAVSRLPGAAHRLEPRPVVFR